MAAAEGTVPTHDLRLDLGPAHPSSAGGLRLRVSLDGDRVATAEPVVGHLHRGVEKLFEVRDYRQAIVLANRHDWLSAFSSELGVALAVERLLGLEVPLRATWGRTLLAELNRLLSHLAFLGAVPAALSPALAGPDGELARTAYAARERVQSLMEEVSGGRMHFMFNRVGGLRDDLPVGWLDQVAEALPGLDADVARVRSLLDDDDALGAATTGVGVLPVALAEAYGVSGPVARASGLDLDLRRDEPYLAYGELAEQGVLRVPVRHEGDARARFGVLAEQAAVSVDLAAACVERLSALGPGPVDVRLPKILRPPEGSAYACTENPLGLNGYYLVSRGEPTPWRLKLRTASFNNVAVLGDLLPGCRVQDLVAVLASMFFVVGDLDK